MLQIHVSIKYLITNHICIAKEYFQKDNTKDHLKKCCEKSKEQDSYEYEFDSNQNNMKLNEDQSDQENQKYIEKNI